MARWRDTQHPAGAAPYYIRGVKFVDGVADAEVTQSIAEFFAATGVVQEDLPALTYPEPTPESTEIVEKAAETPTETKTPTGKPPRTRKK